MVYSKHCLAGFYYLYLQLLGLFLSALVSVC